MDAVMRRGRDRSPPCRPPRCVFRVQRFLSRQFLRCVFRVQRFLPRRPLWRTFALAAGVLLVVSGPAS
ncbi:MAG: hypothetical protein ACREX6_09640, partial [Casimicrobiaceae bacterium]